MSQEQHEQPAAAENDNDNNSSLAGSEWTLEEDTNDGDGSSENGLNRHQLMELEMANLEAKVQVLETEQKSAKIAAKHPEMAMEQKLQEIRQYYLELTANLLGWLNKIQGRNWRRISWVLFFIVLAVAVALSAYLSMKVIVTGTTKVANPKGNYWVRNDYVEISPDGHKAKCKVRWNECLTNKRVVAAKGFPIYWANAVNAVPNNKFFNGTILYYYEIAQLSSKGFRVGLSDGSIPDVDDVLPGSYRNSYAIDENYVYYFLSGKQHLKIERPKGAVKPTWNGPDVIGCGLLLNSKNEVAIFFTVNGILQGKQWPINPSGDRLYPTVMMNEIDLEANFGNNPSNPFKYDVFH